VSAHEIHFLTLKLPNASLFAMKLTLDKMSRLVVPKGLRDRFALKPGDSLEVTLEADGIRLRPVQPSSPIAEEDGILLCSSEVPPSMWDIGAFIDAQREQRSREIGGL
jgi:AbrB family looped-hinge helix DNA binding protein